ncbi:tetratricopeptide repeat protein, partial [Phenylobacterium sp.]|uniref:tetratricopeptide repeat protein n=1 Tax=Phenylobacterium sp. TaxID=1871053 RepID=UPI002FE3B151
MTLGEAVALHRAGDLAAAERAYRAVLAAGEVPEAMANLASLLRRRGETAEARALLERAAALAPDTAGVWRNLGNLLHHAGDLAGAAHAYEAVLRLTPADDETAFDLARVRLSEARFAEAWPLFERRPQRARAEARRLSFPEWQGEPLAG